MCDEPPSYDNSCLGVKNVSGSLNDDKKDSGLHSARVASTSSSLGEDSGSGRTRNSLFGLRDVFRKRRHSNLPSQVPDVPVEFTVMEVVRTVVQPYTDSAGDRVAMLNDCAQLCARHNIDFSLLLQEKSIQDHAALYWAIINGPWPPRAPFEVVAAVLAHSAPLKPETIKDARRACASLRSQEMFQFLRMRPEFGALASEDRFLLGALVPPEEIVVEHMEGSTQPFSVKFRIPQFLKRMSLSREIKLEFIARGRLWQLSFFTAVNPTQKWLRNGGWSVSLGIAENSPSTHAEFGIVFLDSRPSPPSPPTNLWAQCSSDRPLYVPGEPGHPSNGLTMWSWALFDDLSVCIAPDGSVTGVLGVKLGVMKAHTLRTSWPETIPTTPDAECIVC